MKIFTKILKEKGYKSTPSRMAILKIFSENKKPISTDFVYKALLKNKETGGINEATVYRTFSSFEESGILKRVEMKKDSVYFELNQDHHHHIVCTKCMTIEEFKNNEIENLLEKIVDKSHNFKKIKEHSLELFGLCLKCSLKTS